MSSGHQALGLVMDFDITFFAAIGFIFAAYAVVGNDALQTLGTFINSNRNMHWVILFVFASVILVATFAYGWVINDGDPSWGRLANAKKYPAVDIQWYHVLPPFVLLIITRFGVPVSTSFMVLTVFATVGGLTSMLQKSLIGYGLAFVVGALLYMLLSRTLEKFFEKHDPSEKAPWGLATIMGAIVGVAVYYVPPMINPEISYSAATCIGIAVAGVLLDLTASIAVARFSNALTGGLVSALVAAVVGVSLAKGLPADRTLLGLDATGMGLLIGVMTFVSLFLVATRVSSGKVVYWAILQWVTTAYLWSVWLIQDFANIFVFLPRELSALESFGAMAIIVVLLGYTFANKGGPVQRILRSKTAVTDIRSATIIDFLYASLLFLFKEVSDIPMSTTFVFLGLIAGREYGFALLSKTISLLKTSQMVLADASKAMIGLVLSINMAVFLPFLARGMAGGGFPLNELVPTAAYGYFLLIVNLLIIPVSAFLMKNSKPRMVVLSALLGISVVAFFSIPLE